MAIKKGLKVVITKNLGLKNDEDRGDKYDYYFPEAESIDNIELGSSGIVSRVEGNTIYVRLDKDDEEYPFHKNELKFPGQTSDNNQLGKLSKQYVFGLASQMPIFLINERVYSLEGQGNLKSNFFQTSNDGKTVRRGLIESATLASLEELTRAHHSKEYDKIEREYLQEVIEERSHSGEDSRYKLVDFIVNEVFPYFRGDGQSSAKIGKLLGARTAVAENKKAKSKSEKVKEQSKEETFVSKLIDKIEKEKFQREEDEERKTKKLDTLLGYDPRWDVAEFPQDYDPNSILGQVLAGRNMAVVDNVFYNLVWTNSSEHKRILNFGGKNFALVSPKPMDEVKARYDFELSKSVRVCALKDRLIHDEQLRELAQRNTNLGKLVKKKQHDEGGFGFIKDDYYSPEDNSIDGGYSDENSPTYLVFLDVPAHVLKHPNADEYYSFKGVRVAVPIFVNDQGTISYNEPISLNESYEHPFVNEDLICLGKYPYGKLSKLKKGEAVARLLVDTRSVIHSGYIAGTNPLIRLEDLDNKRMSLTEVKRRRLPITNINHERRREENEK